MSTGIGKMCDIFPLRVISKFSFLCCDNCKNLRNKRLDNSKFKKGIPNVVLNNKFLVIGTIMPNKRTSRYKNIIWINNVSLCFILISYYDLDEMKRPLEKHIAVVIFNRTKVITFVTPVIIIMIYRTSYPRILSLRFSN